MAAGLGCRTAGDFFHPVRASSMREACSVNVSVLSVAPWSEYARALQPNFELSTDDAVWAALPDSRWSTEAEARRRRFGKETVVLDKAQGGNQPIDVPSALLPQTGAYGGGGGGGLPPGTPPIDAQRGVQDPVLRFTAATALYQEVQMLNRYIRDAAIPNGYRPYMVRLQVSLMPNRRHAPYDAYTTLSFFVPGARDASEGATAAVPRTTEDGIFRQPFGNAPKVLPVVVTDNLEATVQSRSLDRVTSLLYTLAEFGGGAFLDKMDSGLVEDAILEEVHGRDLNSLFSVSRLSENTLRIRMGAMQQATSDYAMIPRNHHVTLLLMVPDGSPPLMEVASRTELVDTETGEALPSSDRGDGDRLLQRLAWEWELGELPEGALAELLAHVESNDQAGFSRVLARVLPADHPARPFERQLWIELVQLTIGDEYTAALFELPEQEENLAESERIFAEQIVIGSDSGQSLAITLHEARVPEFEKILAVLTLTGGGLGDIVLPARSVLLDAGTHVLHLEFPSIAQLGLAEGLLEPPLAGEEELARRAVLKLARAGEERSFDVRYRVAEPTLPEAPPYEQPAAAPAPRYRWNDQQKNSY